jgi:hypothetical protein
MKMINTLVIGLLSVVSFSGCTSFERPTPIAIAASKMPILLIVKECGDCAIDDSVLEEIRKAYTLAMSQAGSVLNDRPTATLTIQKYSNVSFIVRMIAGPLSIVFPDEIQATLTFMGKNSTISQSGRTPFTGISGVAKAVGTDAYKLLAGG